MDAKPDVALADVHQQLHALHFSSQSLSDFLEQMTVMAAEIPRGDISCGVTVIRARERSTVAASDDRTRELDQIQYDADEGPCLDSAREHAIVSVPDLEGDRRWPEYRESALQVGMRSSLSLPLELGDAADGAVNFYVFDEEPLAEDAPSVLGQFAEEAGRALRLAVRHDELTRETAHLHAAMATRRVIDQALGIVMAQNRCTSDEAFAILRLASQHRNVKLSRLAADIVESASGSAPTGETHFRA